MQPCPAASGTYSCEMEYGQCRGGERDQSGCHECGHRFPFSFWNCKAEQPHQFQKEIREEAITLSFIAAVRTVQSTDSASCVGSVASGAVNAKSSMKYWCSGLLENENHGFGEQGGV